MDFAIERRVVTALEHRLVDRAAIFSSILARNALRREAQLPQLNVRATFEREVEHRLWAEFVAEHGERVHAEVLAERRAKFGPDYPLSAGGRMGVAALVQRALVERYHARRSN